MHRDYRKARIILNCCDYDLTYTVVFSIFINYKINILVTPAGQIHQDKCVLHETF